MPLPLITAFTCITFGEKVFKLLLSLLSRFHLDFFTAQYGRQSLNTPLGVLQQLQLAIALSLDCGY